MTKQLTQQQRRFRQFHGEHPEIYTMLVRLARQAKARGRSSSSIKLMYEVCRQEMFGRALKWPMSNSHTSFYSRLIMAQEPDLLGFFKLAPLRPKKKCQRCACGDVIQVAA